MTDSSPDLRQNILAEQVRLVYKQGPVLMAGATLCGFVITLYQYKNYQSKLILVWFAALLLVTAVRLWRLGIYHRSKGEGRSAAAWGRDLWFGTLFGGFLWAIWPVLFYSDMSENSLMMVSTIMSGMVAISAANGSVYFPAFVSFSLPMYLPLAACHIIFGEDFMVLIGVLMIMYICVNYYFAVRGHQQFSELIMARYLNSDLMGKLALEKQVAERAVIAKSRFLASASHDLRQPLHALRLFINTLKYRVADREILQIVDDMEKSADALNSLFNSLLDISRLDADIIDFQPDHLSVGVMFDRLRAQFEQQASEKGIDLHFDDAGLSCFTDAVLLERILRNLLVNALQNTEEGVVLVRSKAVDDEQLMMEVVDSGCGIPEDKQVEVFSEYVQLDSAHGERDKGMGLGLSIVAKLCRLMDIDLQMRSRVGEGTSFQMIVPRGELLKVKAPKQDGVHPSVVRSHVMVIDDEKQVLQSMKYMLESWGCEVSLAESAREALKIIALSDILPSLVLSDYRLKGGQSGVDAVFAVREAAERAIPAVIITGDTSPDRLREVKASGLELLHKPIDIENLRQLIVNTEVKSAVTADSSRGGLLAADVRKRFARERLGGRLLSRVGLTSKGSGPAPTKSSDSPDQG